MCRPLLTAVFGNNNAVLCYYSKIIMATFCLMFFSTLGNVAKLCVVCVLPLATACPVMVSAICKNGYLLICNKP